MGDVLAIVKQKIVQIVHNLPRSRNRPVSCAMPLWDPNLWCVREPGKTRGQCESAKSKPYIIQAVRLMTCLMAPVDRLSFE
jgi:hypothetical protein